MTSDEAITVLNMVEAHGSLVIQAKEMAVKALEQDSCEDVISREEVKQFLYERIDRLNDDELYDIFSKIIDDLYNELPSVTPQPKIGHWIPVSEGYPPIEDEYKDFLVTDDKGEITVQKLYFTIDIKRQPYFSGMVNPVAWMPSPFPYKPGSEVEDANR